MCVHQSVPYFKKPLKLRDEPLIQLVSDTVQQNRHQSTLCQIEPIEGHGGKCFSLTLAQAGGDNSKRVFNSLLVDLISCR